MKKEIIIIFVIIISIVAAHIISQNYTKKKVALINEKITQLQEIAKEIEENKKEDEQIKQQLLQNMENIRDKWKKINTNMAFYIEHDELEKVNTALILAESYFYMSDYSQGVPELENCKYILQHIQDKESLKIINLF